MDKPIIMTIGRDMDDPKLVVVLMSDKSFIKMTAQQAEIIAAGILEVAAEIRKETDTVCDA